jgi:dihydroorotate dehydrogenase
MKRRPELYGLAYRTVLRRVPPEGAHRAGFGLIRVAGAIPGGPALLRRWFAPHDPVLRVRALGLDLPGPLGLAAGFERTPGARTRWARSASRSSRSGP